MQPDHRHMPLEKLDSLRILVAEYLSLVALDQRGEGLLQQLAIEAMEF